MKIKTFLGALIFIPLLATGLDLADIYSKAQLNDSEIKRLSATFEGQKINSLLTSAKEGLLLNFSGSNGSAISYSYTYEDYGSTTAGTQDITSTLSLSASLPKEVGTSITVQLPITYEINSSEDPTINLYISISQRINPILGWEPEEAKAIQEKLSLIKIQGQIFNREIQLKTEILSSIRDIISNQAKILKTQETIDRLQVEIETNATLRNFSSESYSAQKLEFDLNNALNTITITALDQERLFNSLITIIGEHQTYPITIDEIVNLKLDDLPPPNFIFPDKEKNQNIIEAKLSLKFSELSLSEHQFSGLPDLGIGGSWNTTNKSISINTSFSLPINPQIVELERSKLVQDSRAAELTLGKVINTFRKNVASLEVKKQQYQSSSINYSSEYELMKLKLKEVQTSYDAGIGDVLSVNEARNAIKQIELEQITNAIEGLIIELEISTLSSP